MSIRWSKYLPSYPAILLVPVILAFWVALGWEKRGPHFGPPSYGFPLIFKGRLEDQWCELHSLPHTAVYGFWIDRLLIDLGLALGTAYVVAMIVDRLVFPMIRGTLKQKQDSQVPQ